MTDQLLLAWAMLAIAAMMAILAYLGMFGDYRRAMGDALHWRDWYERQWLRANLAEDRLCRCRRQVRRLRRQLRRLEQGLRKEKGERS